MTGEPDHARCRFWSWDGAWDGARNGARGERGVSIEIRERTEAEALPADVEAAVDAVWAARCAANPRFFNGPMLAFEGFDEERGVIRARRDEFKRLAATPDVATGVKQLGVTGVLIAPDAMGEPHVLLGKRSRETRVYGGMWELGPSGGIDAPPRSIDRLDEGDVWRALRAEITEEVGLAVEPDPGRIIGFVDDPIGGSFEVVVRVEIVRPVEDLIAGQPAAGAGDAWEYEAIRWVAVGEIAAFDAAMGEDVIPPTRGVWRGVGWV